MMTWEDLKSYVGATDSDDDYVESCWDESVYLVNNFADADVVPEKLMDRAYLECGSELYHRRSAPNGIAQFTSYDGSPVRIARDPMTPVYALLRRYVLPL
jgi:hypothetical protein